MSNGNGNHWGVPNRPKVSLGVSFPDQKDGVDGDVQIKQTNLGAKLFGKIGGSWYGAPLTSTAGDPVTRIGVNMSDHLSIDRDSIDIYKNSVKVAEFGSSVTIKGIMTVEAAANDGNLGLLLDNDGSGYNQQVFRGANPEIWMGYTGSGNSMSGDDITADTGDILGSSKIYMNRQEDDSLSTIIFATAETTNYALGGTESEFRIVTGGDIRTNSNRALYIGGSKELYAPDVYSSTAGSANVSVASGGRLTRISSSKRYKDNINYDGVDASVLYNMKPCSYIEKVTGTEFIGLIAEDVHEIEPRLIEYRDIDGADEPDAIKYDHVSAILIKAVQELSAKLDTMQTEINNLK